MTVTPGGTPNYVLGAGKVYFKPNGATAYSYLGNTPSFTVTSNSETLDHFSSDGGTRQKDYTVVTETTRSAQIVCDDIQPENIAMFFFGGTSVLTQTATPNQSEKFSKVKQDSVIQLGASEDNPVGVRGLSNLSVTSDPTGTTYVENTDYTVDLDRGLVAITVGGGIASGADIIIKYDIDAATTSRILSGGTPVEGSLKYVEDNPAGVNRDMVLPRCKLTPGGDMEMKGDAWRQIPFSVEILNPTKGEAVYIVDQPVRTP